MQKKSQSALVFLGLLGVGTVAHAQSDFYLKNGDRVVFYGDSITDQRLYTTFTETFAVTRFPKRNLTFIHSGWGGDRVTGGGGGNIETRLQRDVYAYKPTVMTIMLGMNDGSYRPFDEGIFKTYATGYENIVKKTKAAFPAIRMTLIQPSPFDDVTRPVSFPGGYNEVLVRYGNYVKELARKEDASCADLNSPVVSELTKANASDPKTAVKLIEDRIHPGPGGQLLMAKALLKTWNAPALVTEVHLDAQNGKIITSANTKVTGFGKESLTWTQTDEALPFPLNRDDKVLMLAVQSSDVMESLNSQPLKVTGLTASRYTLKIDGETIGNFSKEELESGINLAALPTPMAKQAMAVHALTLKHNNIHFTRWRQFQVPNENDKSASLANVLKSMDAWEAEVIKEQKKAAQPLPRKYELVP